MSQQTLEGQEHEELVANRFGVTTQGIPIATRTRLMNKIYVTTLSKYVATQSKSKPREQVAIENEKLQQRQQQRLQALLQHTFLCRDKETNLGHNCGNPQCN